MLPQQAGMCVWQKQMVTTAKPSASQLLTEHRTHRQAREARQVLEAAFAEVETVQSGKPFEQPFWQRLVVSEVQRAMEVDAHKLPLPFEEEFGQGLELPVKKKTGSQLRAAVK